MHTCSILYGSYAQIYCCIDMLHHISCFSRFFVSTNIAVSQPPQPPAPSTKTLQLQGTKQVPPMLSCINTPFTCLPLHRLVMGSVCLWHTMGPCLPSMSACSPCTQLLPTPYPIWHGPSSASKQALGSPAPGSTLQPLLNCCCLCSVLQCWLTSYQHCPKVATPRTGWLNAHRTLLSKHGYCQ